MIIDIKPFQAFDSTFGSLQATAMVLYESLRVYAQKWGPSIMQSDDRDVAVYSAWDRPVITESDLDSNYELLKETVYACFENSLKPGVQHEIPVLADFEACFGAGA